MTVTPIYIKISIHYKEELLVSSTRGGEHYLGSKCDGFRIIATFQSKSKLFIVIRTLSMSSKVKVLGECACTSLYYCH